MIETTAVTDSEAVTLPFTLENEADTLKLYVWEGDQSPVYNAITLK